VRVVIAPEIQAFSLGFIWFRLDLLGRLWPPDRGRL
jgi:hypothetical protein